MTLEVAGALDIGPELKILNQAPGAMIVMRGADNVVTFTNLAHRRLFNSGNWVGRPIRDVLTRLEGQTYFGRLDRVREQGRSYEDRGVPVRVDIETGEGETRYFDFFYAPVADDRGAVDGILCECFDVTDRQQAEQRNAVLTTLGDLIRRIDNADDLAYAVAEMLGRHFNVSRAGYGTIDKDAETITIERDWNAPGVNSLAGTLQFRDYGSYIEDLKRGETVVIANADLDPRSRERASALKAITAQAFVNMPVTEHGGFVALLYLNNGTAREWSSEDLSLVHEVAERTRTAVERRRAEAELRQNEERYRFLDALGRHTASIFDPEAILDVTTRTLGEYLGVSTCAYADMEADDRRFTIRGNWTAPGASSLLGTYDLPSFGAGAVERLHAGQPLIVNDTAAELPAGAAHAFQSIDIGATICMPLVKDGVLTALMAINTRAPHRWTHREQALLREVTERSWAHIERARASAGMRESERRFREELERQVAERTTALNQTREHFRLLVEGVTDYAIYMLDARGNVSSWNPGAERIKGYLPEEVIGTNFSRFYTPEDLSLGLPEQALRVASTVGRFEREGWRIRKDGSRFWAHVIIDAIRDPSGVLIGFAKITRDITERRTAQIELERAREQLQQAQKMEAIGNLTGGIAHDFNNLLMAVLGSLELLKKRIPADPALQRLIDNAMQGAQRGSSLTRRMLAFARRQDLKLERVDAGQLVHGMADLLERSLGSMITVELRFPTSLPDIKADPNQLESALLNLAVNARDAIHDRGAGRIVISGREATVLEGQGAVQPGRYVCIAVTDNGEGMNEDTLRRATDPFFTTKGIGKGTGLGLSMVHGLAEQSGGTLILKSTPGEGTTAEIWLPALKDEGTAMTSENDTAPEPAPQEAPVDAGPSPMRILAVDDDALVLMNTAAMLEDMGHHVVEAIGGKQAIAALEKEPFDLVITDHAMPHMTGAQLASIIRDRWQATPVLLATGYAELPPGADPGLPKLSKPFLQADLEKAIMAAVGR